MIGIYKIVNVINNKVYIGQTTNFYRREKYHFNLLKRNAHSNQHLQLAVLKYGYDNFKFEILEECSIDELNDRETYYCNLYNVYDRKCGYNIQIMNNNIYIQSIETKQKLSEIGKTKTKEKNSFFGRKHRDDTKEKNRIFHLGKSPGNKGIPMSEETKRKISESKKGCVSPNKGKSMSQEQKDKISITKRRKFLEKQSIKQYLIYNPHKPI